MRVCGDLPHGTQRRQRACPDETGSDAVRPLARLLRREAPFRVGSQTSLDDQSWASVFNAREPRREQESPFPGASRLGGGNGACMARQLDSLHGTYPNELFVKSSSA